MTAPKPRSQPRTRQKQVSQTQRGHSNPEIVEYHISSTPAGRDEAPCVYVDPSTTLATDESTHGLSPSGTNRDSAMPKGTVGGMWTASDAAEYAQAGACFTAWPADEEYREPPEPE